MFRLRKPGLGIRSIVKVRGFPTYSIHNVGFTPTVEQVVKPKFQPNIFSRSSMKETIGYKNVPVDTYPNPLFRMDKDELLSISREELIHLLRIPYKTISETDKFCMNITSIINEMILQDTKLVKELIEVIHESDMFYLIIKNLKENYKDDKIKNSVLEYLIDPTSSQFRRDFFANVSAILNVYDMNTKHKTNILMNYLNVLTSLDVINERPIVMKKRLYDKLMKLIPRSKYGDLYHYFVCLNLRPEERSDLLQFRKTLFLGSNIEKFVARTGWNCQTWHNVEMSSFGESHEEKMSHFFHFEDLKDFALFFIEKKDVVNANIYLRLIVSKFEAEVKLLTPNSKDSGDRALEISHDLNTIFNVLILHIMEFKSPESGLKVFNYMLDNKFEIDFDTILAIIKILRSRGLFQEALYLINGTTRKEITDKQKLSLTNEILELIKEKYPTSPNILIGYIASFFETNEKSTNVLELLNDLHLLQVTHGDGSCGLVNSFSTIQKANVEDGLRNQHLSPEALTKVYEIILSSHPNSDTLPNLIISMYERYIHCIQGENYNVFQKHKLNDHVVTLLMKYLLKANPSSKQMDLTNSESGYFMAKKIITDYFSKVKVSRGNSTVYLYDLLIYSALTVHNDYKFASWVIRKSQASGLPLSFNQVYPFITYHYSRREFDEANSWYTEMVRKGVKATAPPNRQLFKIARELNWATTGSSYRRLKSRKNGKRKSELFKLNMDPITFIEENTPNLDNVPTSQETFQGSKDSSVNQ